MVQRERKGFRWGRSELAGCSVKSADAEKNLSSSPASVVQLPALPCTTRK